MSEKVTFKVGDLGPFDGTLSATISQGLYELHFERIQGDQTIFRDDRKIQIFRDGDFDIIGQAQRIQFELTTPEKCITSGRIEVLTN